MTIGGTMRRPDFVSLCAAVTLAGCLSRPGGNITGATFLVNTLGANGWCYCANWCRA